MDYVSKIINIRSVRKEVSENGIHNLCGQVTCCALFQKKEKGSRQEAFMGPKPKNKEAIHNSAVCMGDR